MSMFLVIRVQRITCFTYSGMQKMGLLANYLPTGTLGYNYRKGSFEEVSLASATISCLLLEPS